MVYVISASELFRKAKEILNDGREFVEISLMEPDNSDPEDPIPASVHFDAFGKRDFGGAIDYGDIDVVTPDTAME